MFDFFRLRIFKYLFHCIIPQYCDRIDTFHFFLEVSDILYIFLYIFRDKYPSFKFAVHSNQNSDFQALACYGHRYVPIQILDYKL